MDPTRRNYEKIEHPPGQELPEFPRKAKKKNCFILFKPTFILDCLLLGVGAFLVFQSPTIEVGASLPRSAFSWLTNINIGWIFVIVSVLLFRSSWYSSKPNEWLVLLANGEMVTAGVGLAIFKGLTENVVKFPSEISRVDFSAEQVTVEMQGLKVTGFALWSVFRDDDGPFRAYKFIAPGQLGANQNVRGMVESLVRKYVANSSIQKILKDRDSMRQAIKSELTTTLKGWGVWLESVEITEVRICSNSLFEDMQAEFRQDQHLKAEKIRLESEKQLSEQKAQHDIELAKMMVDRDLNISKLTCEKNIMIAKNISDEQNQKLLYEAEQSLRFEEKQAEMGNQNLKIQIEKAKFEKELQLEKQAMQHDIDLAKVRRQLEIEDLKYQSKLRNLDLQIKMEQTMTPVNIQKATLDATVKVYEKLPINEVKLSNFMSPNTGIRGLLPDLVSMSEIIKEA